MTRVYKHKRNSVRNGNVACLVAVLLTTLLGMVGFAVDGGLILSERRRAQAAADSAAMAAACVFYENYPDLYNGGSYNINNDKKDAAATAAKNVASANGYSNNGSASAKTAGTSVVTVNFPPSMSSNTIYNNATVSTSYEGNIRDGCVEVIIDYYSNRYFTSVWGSDTITIRGRAIAKGAWVSPNNGVIVLDYTPEKGSFSDKGGGSLTVSGGDIVVNSSHATAAVQITGMGTVYAPGMKVTGGVTAPADGIITSPVANNIQSGVHPTPDPLAYLPTPAMPTTQAAVKIGNDVFITPGRYTALPNITNGDNLVFTGDGIYWFDTDLRVPSGSLSMAAGTTGVMIYQNSGTFNVNGNSSGSVNLAPMSSGPYSGILFWQPTTNINDIGVQGNGNVNLQGTLYAPNALLTVTGNSSASSGTVNYGSQYVTKHFKVAGTGDVNITYNGPDAANTRVLTLVE